jgi:hypothetical protein
MTPIHILDEEIARCWHAISVHHATFRNALFRAETTATDFDRQHHISAKLRRQGARDLIALNIQIIHRLKRVRARIHALGSFDHKRKKSS